MKRIALLLMSLLLLFSCALAEELEMEISKSNIVFPGLDEMKGRFRPTKEWIIVHRGNLDEHLELVLRRGETEEEVRQRFASDTLLWEAYFEGFADDACVRLERFVDDSTRDIWHLRHLSSKERKEFLEIVNDGLLFPQYDTFSAKFEGNGGTAYLDCGFTTVPPAAYESGRMCVRYINGQAYVLTYPVRGRMAGRSSLRTKRENTLLNGYTPLDSLSFGVKLLPEMPSFEIEGGFPSQADLGDVKISGTVTKGAKVAVSLDGEELYSKAASKGTFSLTLPVTTPGEHEVTFTVTHKKHTDRTETYTLHASADRTPLNLTALPEVLAPAGQHTITGTTAPGAEVILRLDEQEPVTLTTGDDGSFAHTFDIMDDQLHLLYVLSTVQGKDPSMLEYAFLTEYETFREGLDAFEDHLTELTISQLEEDPLAHLNERVKISVRIKELLHTEEGLGVLCTYNPPKGSKHAKTPLYLTFYGYGRDQLREDMTVTIYGTVNGQRDVNGEKRLDILVQYGTYLVTK